MNKRGSIFLATFTVIVFFVFIFAMNSNKEKILEENKLVDVGEIPEAVLDFALSEEESQFIIEKAMNYATFISLNELGAKGGAFPEIQCDKIQEHVILEGECRFASNLDASFFIIFKDRFKEYISMYGFGIDVKGEYDDDQKFFLKTLGEVDLSKGDYNYKFEPGIVYYPEYNFENYGVILDRAKACRAKERSKASGRNDLFKECNNDKDFEWKIITDGTYVLFDVGELSNELGPVVLKFALFR